MRGTVGSHLWSRHFGVANGVAQGFGVAVDGSGNVLVTGVDHSGTGGIFLLRLRP